MTAEEVHVNFAALQQGSQTLGEKAAALNSNMEELVNSLAPIKATWYASGSSAGEAAQIAETRLRQATGDIINIINQFGMKVSDAHDSQRVLETSNTNLFA